MAETVKTILDRVARRLLVTRAAEAFALGAVVGGVVAVPIMAARIIAGPHRQGAALLALMPMLTLAVILPRAMGRWPNPLARLAHRLGLAGPVRWTAALTAMAAAVAASVTVYARWSGAIPPWVVPVALVSAGGVAAACTVFVRGVTRPQAAMYADIRCRLGERLSTALELGQRGDNGPFALAVEAQAIGAWHRRGGERLPYWRRSRALPGVLGLTILGCLVILFIPPRADPRVLADKRRSDTLKRAADQAEVSAGQIGRRAAATNSALLAEQAARMRRLAEAVRSGERTPEEAMAELNRMQDILKASRARQAELAALRARLESELLDKLARGQLSAADRAAMSESLQDAAVAAQDNPALSAGLAEAAAAIAEDDLDRLKAALAAINEATAGASLAANAEAVSETMNDLERLKRTLGNATGEAAARAVVRVSNVGEKPTTVATAGPREGSPVTSAPSDPPIAAETEQARAWAAARERAEEVLTRQAIPVRLRKLVRDYYAAGK